MRIADILTTKGAAVVTVAPGDAIPALLAALAEHNVGAAVVVDAGTLAGIVSERDVVRALHRQGADLLAAPVSTIMTRLVATCRPEDTVASLSVTMTEKRIRHIPVVGGEGELAGIVSIGDVVKSRIDQLEGDREQLEAYITS
jgi:CBS domain-containing protein